MAIGLRGQSPLGRDLLVRWRSGVFCDYSQFMVYRNTITSTALIYFFHIFSGICDLVKCSGNKHCFSKQNGQYDCRCPLEDECPASGEKVCGSDEITYDNECKLKAKACKTPSGLVKIKDGSCGKVNVFSTTPCIFDPQSPSLPKAKCVGYLWSFRTFKQRSVRVNGL